MAIKIPIEIGDIILVGKFRNKPIEVKKIGTDEWGHPTVNDKPILKVRLQKFMKKDANMKVQKLAKEIIAGRIQPTVESTLRTTIILRKDDFKEDKMFHYIMDIVGLHDALEKKFEELPKTDEPVTTHDDYDEIQITVQKSKME